MPTRSLSVLVVRRAAIAAATVLVLLPLGAAERRVPTVDDLLTIESIGEAQISPDAAQVAYTVTKTDFAQDAFVTHVWMADTTTKRTVQLTRGDKSASNPRWSPDGKWIAFTSPRVGDRNQIVYKGFGHGITKPRAVRAVMQHNLAWFHHYLWGDPKPDFAAPDVPKKKTETTALAGLIVTISASR